MKHFRSLFIISLLLIGLLQGCTEESRELLMNDLSTHHTDELHAVQLEHSPYANDQPKEHQALAQKAKSITKTLEHVTDVYAVSLGNHVFIAPQVEHHIRFELKEFGERAEKKLDARLPSTTQLHFSTDQKAFQELKKLEKDVDEKKIDGSETHERLLEIQEYMKPL
ncbi:YhcN/YlaJ family sporulation lipoprotein [Geomicrobium sediminis]|uniref:Sporulation protein n=1 Tax=Geomicrobium sediminis TaxID=1347788 RepID=A0ABS2PE24_9BACL|nr:hypothetical protein [Geomicrobium sediminis]